MEYIKNWMMQTCSVALHECLCKHIRASNAKYGRQPTNSTIGSKTSQLGSWKGLLYLYILRSISEILKLWATEDLKNSIFGCILGRRGRYIYQKSSNAVLLCSAGTLFFNQLYGRRFETIRQELEKKTV